MKERGVLTLPEDAWEKAKHRNDVIGALAEKGSISRADAEDAAKRLGVSARQVYKLVRRYRAGNGLVTDFVPAEPTGGKGKTRITPEIEGIIAETIKTVYLSRQKHKESVVVREVRMLCIRKGLQPPAANTIRTRIRALDPKVVMQKRERHLYQQ